MTVLAALFLFIIGLWLFTYGFGQTMQIFFPSLPGDEPLLPEYFRRHRRFIIRSAAIGFALAAGYWAAAAWLLTMA